MCDCSFQVADLRSTGKFWEEERSERHMGRFKGRLPCIYTSLAANTKRRHSSQAS